MFSTRPRVFHQTPCFPPDPMFSTRPRVFHTPGPRTPGPRPRVFHLALKTPCFPPDPVFSTPRVFYQTPCFPPDPVFSTPRDPVPRDPVPCTPGPRPRVFHLAKTWRSWFIYSDVLFKNLTRKKRVLVSEFTSVKHRMCKIWST